jgi:nucleoside-diphosphate kinase
MIKPDGVQRGLVGEIIKRFESKGYKLIAMKMTAPGKEHMEKHYADLSSKKFFPGLIEYMTSGPVIAMVWQGKNAVLEGRKMLGATMPTESAMGTIRGDFCVEVGVSRVGVALLLCSDPNICCRSFFTNLFRSFTPR